MEKVPNRNFYIKIIFLAVFSAIIFSNLNTISHSIQSLDKLKKAEETLDNVESETARLNEDLEYSQTDDFLEREALKRFNLVKEPSSIIVFEKAPPSENQDEDQVKWSGISDGNTSNIMKWKAFFRF